MAIIARAALAAEGDDVRAWARLSLVNTVFRDTLKGEHNSRALRRLILGWPLLWGRVVRLAADVSEEAVCSGHSRVQCSMVVA